MMSGDRSACGGMEPSLEKCHKQMACLCQQIKAYEKQLECTQAELDDSRSKLSASCREMEDMRRRLNQRDDAMSCQEGRMEELKYEMRERERANQRTIEQLQEKLCKTGDCLNQKEQMLTCCKNDNTAQCATMEEMKSSFTCELQQRDNCIRQMKEEISRLYDELREKLEKMACVERELVDTKSKLHQSCAGLKEADTRISCLQEKIANLEMQLAKDKAQCQKDLEDRDRRINQLTDESCQAQGQIKCLTRALQERDEEIQSLTEQRDNCCRDLSNEKEESASYRERALNFENDNKEICRLLQQKVKRIKELEQVLCCKEEELEQCGACVEELNARIRKMNTEMHGEDGDSAADCQTRLNECRNKLKATQAELDETKKKLDWAVKEMECLAKEVKRLACELERTRKELCEKNSLIEDLQQVIQHAEHDLENRMRRADEQLQCYECDIQDKTRCLSDCEEKALRLQHCLTDKELELDQVTQKLQRSCQENQLLTCKCRDVEESRDCLQRTNNEQRAQLTECCQELRVLKDQNQAGQCELGELKRKYECCTRDMEKCVVEYENTRRCLQEKQTELNAVTEERNCCMSKISSLQCRSEMDAQTLQQQMHDMKNRLETEVNQLKGCQTQLEDSNQCLMQKVSSGQRQQAQMEKSYQQKLDAMVRENNLVRTKMADREDQLQALKDCLTVKESEIMRLNLRLCSMDRCNNNNPGCNALPNSTSQQGDIRTPKFSLAQKQQKSTTHVEMSKSRSHNNNKSSNNFSTSATTQPTTQPTSRPRRKESEAAANTISSNLNSSNVHQQHRNASNKSAWSYQSHCDELSQERKKQQQVEDTSSTKRGERGGSEQKRSKATCVDKGTVSPLSTGTWRSRSCGPTLSHDSS